MLLELRTEVIVTRRSITTWSLGSRNPVTGG